MSRDLARNIIMQRIEADVKSILKDVCAVGNLESSDDDIFASDEFNDCLWNMADMATDNLILQD